MWTFSRALAISLLAGSLGLLYYLASSVDFRISKVVVSGNAMVGTESIETVADAFGANIFWVRHRDVANRLQSLPAIRSVKISTKLPNRLEVHVDERTAVAIWQTSVPMMVDDEGRLLAPAASPSSFAHLPVIHDRGKTPVEQSERVDEESLRTVAALRTLLPQVARANPVAFEYNEDGIGVTLDSGLRVRFGGYDDLLWKVHALVAVRGEIARTGQRAELVDVRFRDRPYFR
jgi:cell division septal protein FtsQ